MDNAIDIEILRKECVAGNIKWTVHILERMQERNINPTDVIHCIIGGEIIEQYPQAYPYPACLILGMCVDNDTYIHVVAGYGSGFVWIVTVYVPDEDEWINGFTERKR